jgi:hypothetical protein
VSVWSSAASTKPRGDLQGNARGVEEHLSLKARNAISDPQAGPRGQAMTAIPRILLLDDGELQDVAATLEGLDLPFTRLRGGQIPEDVSPPLDLLITTPRRAPVARRGSPPGAKPGYPTRIIAVEEDCNSMRRMLRRMGFHLLVRRPAHPEVWRLLIQRALYHGTERRDATRVPVGSEVRVTGDRAPRTAILLDISNRGCRLRSHSPFEPGANISLEIGAEAAGGRPLSLHGRLVRVANEVTSNKGTGHTAALVFDPSIDETSRQHLARLLNTWASGPGSLTAPQLEDSALPPCESPEIPGLTLDDETDPPVSANVEVELNTLDEAMSEAGETGSQCERRQYVRGTYSERVLAFGERYNHVLMGRDLSSGGMRIEAIPDLAPGDRFRLAIYGPDRVEPTMVETEVARDDGESGMALRFLDVTADTAARLEKLVACLPDVESLENSEADGLGTVISEIVA